jgi:cell wall-associated NlpC family hydrolase
LPKGPLLSDAVTPSLPPLLAVVLALACVLVLPLPGRAGTGPKHGGGAHAKHRLRQRPRHHIVRDGHRRPAADFGTRVISYARHLVGVPYRWGGTSPRTGFDCSGLVRYVFAHFGVSLAHSSFADFARGRWVTRARLRPGDLVFFYGGGHVGIYLGHARFIEAPHGGTVVRISTMSGWYGSAYSGARRVR